jgi:hypothetical protein
MSRSLHHVHLDQVAPQPWRNGGGLTRELLSWPGGTDGQLRLSVADITQDGPFSSWKGWHRHFAVLEGPGVALSWFQRQRECRVGGAPVSFNGGDAPQARLLGGPTRDLNLMLAASQRGGMRLADGPARPGPGWRGCYSHHGATLRLGDEARLVLAPGELVWAHDDPRHWHLEAPAPATYWLFCAPAGAAR